MNNDNLNTYGYRGQCGPDDTLMNHFLTDTNSIGYGGGRIPNRRVMAI